MSIEGNSTLTNFHSPKNIYNFKDSIINGNKTFNPSRSSINKNAKKIFYNKMSNENKNKKKYYNKNQKNIFSKMKPKKLINKSNYDFKNKENYKELKEQVDIINKNNRNKIFRNSLNKQNKKKLNNYLKYNSQDNAINTYKNNFKFNQISFENNKCYTNKNDYIYNNVSLSPSNTTMTSNHNQISYKNLYNLKDRNYSYSIRQNNSFIKILLNEDKDDYLNIHKNNNKLLNKLYSYSTREKYNYKNPNPKEINITAKIVKIMKKSLEYKSNSLQKKQICHKSDFINYVNNSVNNNHLKLNKNLKISSHYFNNDLSPTMKGNNYKNKNNSKLYYNKILKSASNYLESMKEERKTNKFIRELSKKNSISHSSRFSFDKENIDNNDDFYTNLKINKMNGQENIILFENTINEKNRAILKKKNSFKTPRNTWKTKNLKILYHHKNYLNDNQKSYVVKKNIIMPANNAS